MRRSEHYNTHRREEEHTVLFDKSESHVTQWISDHRLDLLEWILQTGYEGVKGIHVVRYKFWRRVGGQSQ